MEYQVRLVLKVVLVAENKEVDKFFSTLSNEEKKSIGSLSVKLATQVEKNSGQEKKIAGLTEQKRELEMQVQRLQHENKNVLQVEIKKLKNENSSLYSRLDMKSYLVEEYDKEKKQFIKEREELQQQIQNLMSLGNINEILKNNEKKAQWASGIRHTQPLEEQCRIFYESFRVLSSKEVELKAEVRSLRNEIDCTNKSLRPIKDELEEFRTKYLKLKKANFDLKSDMIKANKLVEQLQQQQTSVSKQNFDLQKASKKRKLNELYQNGEELEFFISAGEESLHSQQQNGKLKVDSQLNSQQTGQVHQGQQPVKSRTQAPKIGTLFGMNLAEYKDNYMKSLQMQKMNSTNSKLQSGVQLGMTNFMKK